MDELSKEIGYRIREKRDFLKISRETFSELIDITPDFLAQIESGKRGMSLDTFYKICKTLNVSADYLLMGKTEKNDISGFYDLLSNMDTKYIDYVRDIVKSIILIIGTKE